MVCLSEKIPLPLLNITPRNANSSNIPGQTAVKNMPNKSGLGASYSCSKPSKDTSKNSRFTQFAKLLTAKENSGVMSTISAKIFHFIFRGNIYRRKSWGSNRTNMRVMAAKISVPYSSPTHPSPPGFAQAMNKMANNNRK